MDRGALYHVDLSNLNYRPLQKRRQIEAINGAWAVIGLTAGLVIEGHTGKSILDQVSSYKDCFRYKFLLTAFSLDFDFRCSWPDTGQHWLVF